MRAQKPQNPLHYVSDYHRIVMAAVELRKMLYDWCQSKSARYSILICLYGVAHLKLTLIYSLNWDGWFFIRLM